MASRQAEAARMIRTAIKEKGLKASVKSQAASMMTAVNIWLERDSASEEDVQWVRDYAAQFEYGHFDGMTDSYMYSNRNDDLPQVKFVMVSLI